MSNTRRWLLLPVLGALLLAGLLASQVIAQDPVPPFPHKFYGALTINGELAAAGSMVSADGPGVMADTEHNPIVTDESGFYGEANPISPDKLTVQGTEETIGQPLAFYVNGVRAETGTDCLGVADTFCYDPGEITELDLNLPVYTMTVTAEGCAPVNVVYTSTIGAGGLVTGTVFSETEVFVGIAGGTEVELTADDNDPCCGFDSWLLDGTETITETNSITVTMDGDRTVEMMSSARAQLEASIETPNQGDLFAIGEMFTVTAQVANTCLAGDALSATAELSATQGVTVTEPVMELGALNAGEVATATWSLTTAELGDVILTVLPDGIDAQTSAPITDTNLISDTVTVTVQEAVEFVLHLPFVSKGPIGAANATP